MRNISRFFCYHSALFADTSITIACADAADSNDDGRVDISDAIRTLFFLFVDGTANPLPLPGATTAGEDPTADGLNCARYPAP